MRKNTAQAMTTNYHILTIKHVGATNTNAAQVKIISERFNASKKIPYSNEAGDGSPCLSTAIAYLHKKGFNIIGKGEGKDHYYLISTTFESPAIK